MSLPLRTTVVLPGLFHSMIDFTLSGMVPIPCEDILKPRKLISLINNLHFFLFNLKLDFLSLFIPNVICHIFFSHVFEYTKI